jgi:Transposase IS116/IS110/IS902 family
VLLITADDHPGRLRSEAAWAHLCAAAPIPASSGKVSRHRLNRCGDRQANQADLPVDMSELISLLTRRGDAVEVRYCVDDG